MATVHHCFALQQHLPAARLPSGRQRRQEPHRASAAGASGHTGGPDYVSLLRLRPPHRCCGCRRMHNRQSGARCSAASGSSFGDSELSSYEVEAGRRAGRSSVPAPPVDVAIEPGPTNSRCIWAGVDVAAPAQAVYAALTAYESLGTFIPGLAENRCLERYPGGCRLLQVGQQDVALGLRFCARVCLRIREHPAGMPSHLLALSPNTRTRGSSGNEGGGSRPSSRSSAAIKPWWPFNSVLSPGSSSGSSRSSSSACSTNGSSGDSSSGEEAPPVGGRQAFRESLFLRPRSPLGCASPMDISFELVEGDFAEFRGVWRVQAAGARASRLSYTLFVRPQPWLPVGLIEQRIQGEIGANLAAVKAYVEGQTGTGAALP